MYKVKNHDIINIVMQTPGGVKLSPEIFRNRKLKNFKTIYWLGRIETQILSLYTAYDKTRNDLIVEKSLKDKDGRPIMRGNRYIFSEDEDVDFTIAGEFGRKLQEIAEEEVEISINKIKLMEEDLKYKEGGEEIFAVSGEDMHLLEPFVEFPQMEGEGVR